MPRSQKGFYLQNDKDKDKNTEKDKHNDNDKNKGERREFVALTAERFPSSKQKGTSTYPPRTKQIYQHYMELAILRFNLFIVFFYDFATENNIDDDEGGV